VHLIFAGVDWAEAHHDVHIEDEDGRRLAAGRLSDGIEGIARFHDLVASHAEDPREVTVGSRPTGGCSWRRWSPRAVRCSR
jgi:hypothetical protein